MSAPESPGDALRDRLAERRWSQKDLSEVLGRSQQWVSEVITGKKSLTVEAALQLGVALGTGPGYWLAMQDRYRLWVLDRNPQHKARLKEIKRRADQRFAPVRRYSNSD